MRKIAIDIDNTISNTSDFFRPFAEEFNNRIVNRGCQINYDKVLPRSEEWTEEELKEYMDSVFNKEAINIPVKEDAPLYINKIKELGYEIIILTNRGIGENDHTDLVIPEYLAKNNIPYDEIVTRADDKSKYLSECDFFVDDLINNCENALASSNCKVIMMASHKTKDYYNDKIYKVNNWHEVYNYILDNR